MIIENTTADQPVCASSIREGTTGQFPRAGANFRREGDPSWPRRSVRLLQGSQSFCEE
jgi:hypothetical protein